MKCELCQINESEIKVTTPHTGSYEFDVCKPCMLAFHRSAQQMLALDFATTCRDLGHSFSGGVCRHCGLQEPQSQ